jgi:hypothetical protein
MTEETIDLAAFSKPWQKFFKKFEEIDTLKVSEWKEVHILAHICRRFKQLHGIEFSITVKGAPSKSPDVYLIKRIMLMLNTSNMKVVKNYIDWVYDVKVIPKRVRFQKVGFFLTNGFANEFKFFQKKEKEFDRSTQVPESYKHIAKEIGVDIETYGDLAFIMLAAESNSDSKYKVLIGNLELLGLDLLKVKELK